MGKKKPEEILHENAVAIREMLRDVATMDYMEYDRILSKKDSSPPLISAVNVILRKFGIDPVKEVTGYDILVIDKVLQQEQICHKCQKPEDCPFKGAEMMLMKTETGIHANYVWCLRHYRIYLMNEIKYLAKQEIPDLDEYSISELRELRNQLKEKLRK